jgi:hypothetical protein
LQQALAAVAAKAVDVVELGHGGAAAALAHDLAVAFRAVGETKENRQIIKRSTVRNPSWIFSVLCTLYLETLLFVS